MPTPHVVLYECRDDLTPHLKSCFLSRADLKEYEVILQRAGFGRLSHEQVKKLRVLWREILDKNVIGSYHKVHYIEFARILS